jgi:hypothetical protein
MGDLRSAIDGNHLYRDPHERRNLSIASSDAAFFHNEKRPDRE